MGYWSTLAHDDCRDAAHIHQEAKKVCISTRGSLRSHEPGGQHLQRSLATVLLAAAHACERRFQRMRGERATHGAVSR